MLPLALLVFLRYSESKNLSEDNKPSNRAPGVAWESLRGEELSLYVRKLSIQEVRAFLAVEQRPSVLREADWLNQITILEAHPAANFYLEIFARYGELDFKSAWSLITVDDNPISSELADAVYRGRGRAIRLEAIMELVSQCEKNADTWPIFSIIAAARGWAEVEPEVALDWAWRNVGWNREYVLTGVVMGLPKNTPWLELWNKANSMGSVSLGVAGFWKAQDGEFAETLAVRWIQVNPDAAIKWMTDYTEEDGSDFIPEAFAAWLRADIQSAVQWLSSAEADGRVGKGELARRIYYSTMTPSDDILMEVMKLNAGPTRDFAIEALIDRQYDYESTLKQIVESDEIPEELRKKAQARLVR